MNEKTFCVDSEYTKSAVLNVLSAYAKSGKLTKDKERLLDFIEESIYNGLTLRHNQTEFIHPYDYRVYIMNEIIHNYESVLKKADKRKWLSFLEHELYEVYQRVIFDMKEGL